ncbi:MAG: ubiE 2 [Mycobacterium sp.]|nr:ubiE 2 [Mycobacterium sp.]
MTTLNGDVAVHRPDPVQTGVSTADLFERLAWRDPVTGGPLEPIVTARTPAGVPMSGALRRVGTTQGYPIVDCVVRLTPELAHRHRAWLAPLGLTPPESTSDVGALQAVDTVDSFGWQWMWAANMRTEEDLAWRVARRFGVEPSAFAGGLALDAGAGAGDQTRYLSRFSAGVVSIDLSEAIDLVASKMRMHSEWVGIQGDVTSLPFADGQFDTVYCEGVIQHTRDSAATVRELVRVTAPGGLILASHYVRRDATSLGSRLFRRVTLGHYNFLRDRLSRMERYRLLLVTGVLAALSYVPLLGRLVRWSGTAMYSDLMPDLKTTWTNTFDKFGNHSYQRFINVDEFWAFFERLGNVRLDLKEIGVVTARKEGGT